VTDSSQPVTTVLVVDDDPYIRELLKSFLEQKGMRVLLAETAEQALALPELREVEVALLDIRLPGRVDGHALQQELNRSHPDMAKIIMSGQADLDDVIAAFSDQAFSFAQKPFSSLKEIAVLIERAAQSKKLEAENRAYAARLRESNIALSERAAQSSAESERYQQILAHLYQVSAQIGRIAPADSLLDFICQAVVEAGAYRRAVILLADQRCIVRSVGAWQEGGVPPALRSALASAIGKPLRPFEFERDEERIGSAIYRRSPSAAADATANSRAWLPGDQLFMPMVRGDGVVFGYLSLDGPSDGARPSEGVIRLLDVLLGHGALHLEAQDLRDELKKRADELELRVVERTHELRRSEERYSRLVNLTTDIVYVTDDADRLVFLNEAFARTLGYVRENYIGRAFRRLLEDVCTESPINRRALTELAGQEGDHSLHHVEVVTRQGDKRTLEINRSIVRQGGVVTGTQGIIRDITEHRTLLQQLVNAERLAATGKLAAGIAHEINNPLQAMASQIGGMQRKVERGESIGENIAVFREGIERIRHIVGSMLDLHRAPALTQTSVNLNEVVQKVIALVGQQAKEHDVRAQLDLAPDLPAIAGSPQELQQVVLNLVLNAIEAMPDGGDVTIATRATSETVELRVKDTGVGIPPEHVPQLFEPFFTFKPSLSGTGLGLYLSKNIVDLHGGRITVESKRGHGATFVVSFPRSQT